MDGLELGNEVVGCYFVVARGVVSCVSVCALVEAVVYLPVDLAL